MTRNVLLLPELNDNSTVSREENYYHDNSLTSVFQNDSDVFRACLRTTKLFAGASFKQDGV